MRVRWYVHFLSFEGVPAAAELLDLDRRRRPLLHNPVVPRTILTTNNTTWTQEAKGAAPKDMPSSATKKGGGRSSTGLSTPSPSGKGGFRGTEGNGAVEDT